MTGTFECDTAFAGPEAALAENQMIPRPCASTIRIEVQEMRSITSGQLALPLLLVLSGALLMMDRLDMIRINHLAQLWPIVLIAVGLEQLYLWTVSGDDR
jgi:hypothetical protein